MKETATPTPEFSMEQVRAFVSSPAGQQLLSLLQKKGGSELKNAQNLASNGQMDAAKSALSSLLTDPQIQQLLKQLGG